MAARSTLNQLIRILRGMTSTTTTDYSIDTVNFWDADVMTEVLDRYRQEIKREELQKIESYTGGGTVAWLEYQSQYRNFEQTDGGSAIFIVEEGDGDNQSTANWSADYVRGLVTFGSDTSGTAYFLTGRSYDLNAAAADIWRQKAAYYAQAYDVKTDNQALSRSQLMQNCVKMADYYESLGGPQTVYLYRTDSEDAIW